MRSTSGTPDPTVSQRPRRSRRLDLSDPAVQDFWIERHLQTLTTVTPQGRPHTVPVAGVLEPGRPLVQILCSRRSRKVRNVRAAHPGAAWATVCQVDGRRWTTLEGTAQILTAPDAITAAERLYATRFRTPRPNPDRVVLTLHVSTVLGNLP